MPKSTSLTTNSVFASLYKRPDFFKFLLERSQFIDSTMSLDNLFVRHQAQNPQNFYHYRIGEEILYERLTRPIRYGKLEKSVYQLACILLQTHKGSLVSVFCSPYKKTSKKSISTVHEKERQSILLTEWLFTQYMTKKEEVIYQTTNLEGPILNTISSYLAIDRAKSFPFPRVFLRLDLFFGPDLGKQLIKRSVKFVRLLPSLFEYPLENPLNLLVIKKLVLAGLKGLKLLHNNGIAHNNIHPGCFKRGKLEGLDSITPLEKNARVEQLQTPFLAPEWHMGVLPCRKAADIWALGVTAFYLATLQYPCDANIHELDHIEGNRKIRSLFKDMVIQMTKIVPFQRPSVESLLQYEFLSAVPPSFRRLHFEKEE